MTYHHTKTKQERASVVVSRSRINTKYIYNHYVPITRTDLTFATIFAQNKVL